MIKKIYAVTLAAFIAGCAGSPSDDRYIHYGQVHGERVRVPPCNPFHADELMDWATDLDSRAYHERDARAAVDADGRVRCKSGESAGSSSVR